MPHHFKWINRATLLFNLASAERVARFADVHDCARWRKRRCDQRCTGLSLSRRDRLMDGTRRRMAGCEDDGEKSKTTRSQGADTDKWGGGQWQMDAEHVTQCPPFKTNVSIQPSHRDLQCVSSGLLFHVYKDLIKFQQNINITQGVCGHKKWHLPEDISIDNHRPADWNLEMLPNTPMNTHAHTHTHGTRLMFWCFHVLMTISSKREETWFKPSGYKHADEYNKNRHAATLPLPSLSRLLCLNIQPPSHHNSSSSLLTCWVSPSC